MNDFEILEQKFLDFAGADRKLSIDEFQEVFDFKNDFLCKRLFTIFDVDKTGGVNFREFVQGFNWAQEDEIRFAFRLHDINDDGYIDKNELAKFIGASLRETQFYLPTSQLQQLRDILLDKADTNEDGEISLPEFEALLGQSPRLQNVMSVSPAQWLQPSKTEPLSTTTKEEWLRRWHHLQNNWGKVLFVSSYIAVNVFLFFRAYTNPEYASGTSFLRLARGCGLALNFSGALVLVPIMRRWMTWLRKTKLNDYLPIDKHLAFHKLVGHTIFVLAVVHTVAHIGNLVSDNQDLRSFLSEGAGLTGVLLLLILLLMWITAQPFVREKGKFNLFYIAHFAYIPWLGLMIAHGPHFIKWVAVSLGAFLIEQIVRYRQRKRTTHITNAQILPSNVLALEIARPHDFSYKASDYLYVKCPGVASFEWHPFTISSAPEKEDSLCLHIRAVGSWTGTLYSQFRDWMPARKDDSAFPKIPVYLDGPYHSPSSHIYRSQHAVLIAGGIGVTPYASILQSILHQRQMEAKELNLEKVHFYWFNRDQSSFEWFLALLQKLEAEDTFNLFDINLYLTGMPKNINMQLVSLYTAMDLLHNEHKVDLVTGLKNQTHAGRPNWNEIFPQLKLQYPTEKVDVFYCGPRGLSRTLGQLCNAYGFSYRKENF
ncbi:hypothetical protein C1752_02757 [Acaryochloris thomasi RCC1774]|uniref:Uncharacterized protein n=1 Tax=Acaryochloris thomasi RCC1774 TaxID=1764569 RepID=A0A2W1JNB6_9CYAN|nr:ferric reductase-like transmembrane domain-containing protein [Acaryochloris thomasi]PZD72935.1 hypothetical protein C1752_02757 [Acaryochloris thomasi RCC1774]